MTSKRTQAIAAIGAILVGGLLMTGCSSSTDATNDDTSSIENGADMDISAEQQDFLADLLAEPLPQDEATSMIEEAGYVWRLGTIDGEPQAVTMDYRIDRLTLTVDDGLVTDATWG